MSIEDLARLIHGSDLAANDGDGAPWDGLTGHAQRMYRANARAVVLALRTDVDAVLGSLRGIEPTDEGFAASVRLEALLVEAEAEEGT